METVLGIDFGTTNTVAAYVEAGGRLEAIRIRDRSTVLPSVVWYGGQGDHLLVGHLAQQQVIEDPAHTVFGFKRFIGRAFNSPFVQRHRSRFLYELVPTPERGLAVRMYQRDRTLEEVGATVFGALMEHTTRQLQRPVTQCVLTVPAHFGYSQRECIRRAAERQQLKVKAMVNEPTAAAVYYARKSRREGPVLVFDLGGGTFDATLMHIQRTGSTRRATVEVLASGGDAFLGGADFDGALVDFLVTRFERESAANLRESRVVMQRLAFAAEQAKKRLTAEDHVEVSLPFVAQKEGRILDLRYKVTRAELEACTAPLVERSMALAEELMGRAGLKKSDLVEVVMVGGQTRMPIIQKRLQQTFGAQPSAEVHPELGVAAGAALLGRGMGELLDVVPMSIHVMAVGIGDRELIPANIPVPVTQTLSLGTRPPRGQPLVLTFYEAVDVTSNEREEIGIARIPFSWLDANPGPLTLEAGMDADFRLSITLLAGRRRLPLQLSVRPRGPATSAG